MTEVGTFTDFADLVMGQARASRFPVDVSIELSHRCPLNCSHCYNNLPMSDASARSGELTTAEHFRIVDELADMGSLWLLYTGGEIFARRDFMEIYEHAKRRGMLVTLFTNGTLITEEIVDRLAELPPFSMEVTLYGRTEEVYETLTRIPGSWRKAMRGIDLILSRKLPLKLKTVVVSVNKHEIVAMAEYAESLGVDFRYDGLINPRIDCSSSPLHVRLTPAEVVAFDVNDEKRMKGWVDIMTVEAPPVPPEGVTPNVYGCGGGVTTCAIDPYGAMSICVLSHMDKYDLRGGSVRDGWERFLSAVRFRKAGGINKCTACALHDACGSCPATAELENGDPEAPVDFLCQVAHLRAAVADVTVRPHGDCEYCLGGSARDVIEKMIPEVHEHAANPTAVHDLTVAATSCGSGACGGCSIGASQ